MLSHQIIRYTPPPPVAHQPFVGHFRPTQADLDAFLLNNPIQPGDWLIFKAAAAQSTWISERCSIVMEINRDAATVKTSFKDIQPFLLLGLLGTNPYSRTAVSNGQGMNPPWVRWSDLNGLVIVPEERRTEMNDDFVQNYIKNFSDHPRQHLR